VKIYLTQFNLHYQTGRMIRILSFEANAPPGFISQKIKLIKSNPN